MCLQNCSFILFFPSCATASLLDSNHLLSWSWKILWVHQLPRNSCSLLLLSLFKNFTSLWIWIQKPPWYSLFLFELLFLQFSPECIHHGQCRGIEEIKNRSSTNRSIYRGGTTTKSLLQRQGHVFQCGGERRGIKGGEILTKSLYNSEGVYWLPHWVITNSSCLRFSQEDERKEKKWH